MTNTFQLTKKARYGNLYLDIYLNIIKRSLRHMAFGDTFKALSDPTRRQILELLRYGPLPAGDITNH